MPLEQANPVRFVRDARTWFSYLILTVFGFMQSVLGSVTPFLRDEYHYTRSEVGLHFTVYAVGLVASGLFTGALMRRFGTLTLMRVVAVLMVLCVVSVVDGGSPAMTITSAFGMGLFGGVLQTVTQAEVAWYHGRSQEKAMTEAFVLAGIGVFSGPLLIGQAAKLLGAWRLAFVAPVLVLLLILLCFRHLRADAPHDTKGSTSKAMGRLSITVLTCWTLVVFGISAEWGIGFWGAQFLEARLTLSAASAVSLMSVFFGGTVVGRVLSSRLLTTISGKPMLLGIMLIGAASIAVAWFSTAVAATVCALAIAGMSLGNFFPLILAVAMRADPTRTSLISTGATQAVGLSLIVVPMVLGLIAGQIGLVNAVGLLTLMPVLMFCLALPMKGARSNQPVYGGHLGENV